MSTGKMLTALAAGFATGLALGILFAPDKGANTRQKLAKKGKEYKDKIGHLTSSISEKVQDTKKEAGDLIQHSKSRLKDTVQEIKSLPE